MDQTVDGHLTNLRAISNQSIPVSHSDQFHRYFWLPDNQIPPGLLSTEKIPGTLRSNYQMGCREALRYWLNRRKEEPLTSCSPVSIISGSTVPLILSDEKVLGMWKSFSKRDNVSKILLDPQMSTATPPSLYGESFAPEYARRDPVARIDRSHHIKSNPISKFGEALFMQRCTIRK